MAKMSEAKKGTEWEVSYMKNMKVVTSDYVASNGDDFYIVTFTVDSKYLKGRQYGAINYKDVEQPSGKIKRVMNGHEMYMHNTIAEVINDIEFRIKLDELAGREGISKTAALLLMDGKRSKAEAVKLAEELEKIAENIGTK